VARLAVALGFGSTDADSGDNGCVSEPWYRRELPKWQLLLVTLASTAAMVGLAVVTKGWAVLVGAMVGVALLFNSLRRQRGEVPSVADRRR